jgi:hypothetical protein
MGSLATQNRKILCEKATMLRKSKKTLLEWALEYNKLGLCVIPIPYGKKAARIRWGKYQQKHPDENQLRKWFSNKNRNIAVVLGPVSGDLVCRDFDTTTGYESWFANYPDLAKKLPTVRTSKGGHVYFQSSVIGIKKYADGELRGKGGYCLLPPSVHPNGQTYQWVNPISNGNLLVIDPKLAGFIPDVTERAERTEENSRELNEILVCKSIGEAIKRTLPKILHTRHRKIFDFARELKSMPEYTDADPNQFRSVVEQWHEKALPNIETKEFEETWIDFLKGWHKAKWKIGESPMAQIFEKAIHLEPPKIAVKKYPDHSKLKILVSLCRELQRAAGSQPFFLTVRTGARLLKVDPMTISRWLFLLESDEILKLVSKGGTAKTVREASRYRYIAN